MIKTFKFSSKGPQKLWFVSDYHYNHQLEDLWQTRGFSSIKEHNEWLIETTNKHVGENDILFNLGDLTLNSKQEDVYFLLNNLKIRNIISLLGNHPNPIKRMYFDALQAAGYPEGVEVYPFKILDKLTICGNDLQIFVDNQPIFLSHYPHHTWEFRKKNGWHVTGNEHGKLKEYLPDNLEGKKLDVSWEVFRRPIEFSELKAIMDRKSNISYGHH